MGIQASDLVGVHDELVAFWAIIEDMHVRPFHRLPIIEKVPIEELPAIWGMMGKNC